MAEKYTIISNTRIAKDIYEMILGGSTEKITNPGQFINIELDGFFLRRPISVCDITDSGNMVIIYKLFGDGTHYMSTLKEGTVLDVLSGLGNGFDIAKSGDKPLLIGGGVGVPPLYMLAKKLIAERKIPSVILGFNNADEVFYKEEFEQLGCKTLVATVDGSIGIKGFVTDAIKEFDYNYIFTCGPLPMLKAIYNNTEIDGQYSFEERMGCGIGACMGCTCKTQNGYKRICKDGPVLRRSEILW
ncbi:MAG: dihydroorotate oxidase [Clostridiales bacterium GWF2_36_10]|nr:MAG: dihydroorotate oxidase [Clostridiales bacterium GWF2_36_10]HAN21384.1 dihydroorotate dehydrogenase electron transfer subunit [Clostridiales bacterium]